MSGAWQIKWTPGLDDRGVTPSGSDQRRSHMGPSCGTSCFRSIARICKDIRMDSSTQGHIAYLIDAVEVGTQTTMDAKDASVNNRSEGEVVEDFTTPPPDISSAVFALTLVVKAVYLC